MSGEGAANRRRGNNFEREVVNFLKGRGLDAERAWGSDGRSFGLESDVDIKVETLIGALRLQCKRQKRPVAANYRPAEHNDAQIIRGDRDDTFVVMTLAKYADLLLHLERHKLATTEDLLDQQFDGPREV